MSDNTVRQITTDDLRRMEDQEGLVLLGCFEDPQEWIDGINELLTDAGILLDGSTFDAKNVFLFEHGGISNLLFSFEGVKLDMGRLAMWRFQTHGQFGGTWLSDFVVASSVSLAPPQRAAAGLAHSAAAPLPTKPEGRLCGGPCSNRLDGFVQDYQPTKPTKKKGKDAYER